MTEISKTVADRLVFSEQVMQAIEVQQRAVSDGISRVIGKKLPKDVDVPAVVGWLGSLLAGASASLREADLAHSGELSDDPAARRARDDANAALRGILISARSAVSGAYGDALTEKVGLATPLVARADQLATLGTHVTRLLRKERAPREATPGTRVDLGALADEIDARAATLKTALEGVRREEREAQTTQSARDAAIESWERVYGGVGEVFAGLCTLGGLDDLAAKLRPTARRRAGIPEAPPAEPEPATPSPEDPPPAS